MKLLVTDYDNTLELHYDFTDNDNILKRNIIAIDEFMKNNICCIATGRHFDAIYKTLIEKNINFNYLCANNGAELYDKDYKLLFCLPIDEYDFRILSLLKENIFFRHPCDSKMITSANLYIGCSCCETDIYLETKARRLKKGDKLTFQNISPYSYQWNTEFNGINKIRYDFKNYFNLQNSFFALKH